MQYKKLIHQFIANEDGQGMVEYGLIIALVTIVVIAAIAAVGTKLHDQLYKNIVDGVVNAADQSE